MSNVKNFDKWNINKKGLEGNKVVCVTPNAREVWWVSLGVNIGSEQDGLGANFERPVLILKKLSPSTFLVFPLSTKEKLEKFQYKVIVNGKEGYVLLDQVKVIDTKRFLRKMGYVDKETFEIIKQKFINLF